MTEIVTDWSAYYPYFRRSEFECKHTGKCEMRKDFMDLLLAVRIDVGLPFYINSGYRAPEHPIEAAKDEPGEHAYGGCADIRVGGRLLWLILEAAFRHGFTRIGAHRPSGTVGYTHLGNHPDFPQKVAWSYGS